MLPTQKQLKIFFLGLLILIPSLDSTFSRAQESNTVEIIIQNSRFEVHEGVMASDQPVILVLFNMDDIQHGFVSSLFKDMEIIIETDEGEIFGRGMEGIHVKPKKLIRIKFTPTVAGQFTFRCDLHPSMKGEIVVLSVRPG